MVAVWYVMAIVSIDEVLPHQTDYYLDGRWSADRYVTKAWG